MNNKKLLIPVDGSPQSMTAVEYAGKTFSKDAHITLFHVRAKRPETFLDFRADYVPEDISFDQWREMCDEKIDKFLEDASRKLRTAGFEEGAVEIVPQNLKQGYARDILEKSRDGFDAMVFGRYGFSSLGAGVLGGVAAKMVESVKHIPLVLVGGKPATDGIVVAFDSSSSSKKAVECVGNLADKKNRILLLTVVRPLNSPQLAPKDFFKKRFETAWVDANTRKIVPVIALMRKKLVEQGFDGDQIEETIIREKTSRAEGIVGEARAGSFSTVVVGRKGLSAVPEFVMGRVTRKVLFLCDDRAIWIV